ncbi:hypothetical protein Nepgr_020579 [Nepenthes gracilis]|uniref:catalase n=1 Tax=Nepenthes gracilis TaxID=150966 RepID=A0AAD3SVJ2_NEPGR|nr:hypothetical protein Nepgr_020579 [Nepenthes gracilis]
MHDVSYLTCFEFLWAPGFSEPMSDRFSTVFHEQGCPEILQNPRGIAMQLSTNEGAYDVSQTRALALLQDLANTCWDKPMDGHGYGPDLLPASCKSSKVQPKFMNVYEITEISKVARKCSPSHTALKHNVNTGGC